MTSTQPQVTLNNDVDMPALGLGVFQTPPDETRDAVRAEVATHLALYAGWSCGINAVTPLRGVIDGR